MKTLKLLAGCLVAALAMSSVAVASASAAQPEFGHCKVVPKGTGEYNNKCTKSEVGNAAKGDWEAGPGEKPGFIWKAEFKGFSSKFHDCVKAITFEELAKERAQRAESASEPEKAQLEEESREFAQDSENAYLLAANPSVTPWTRAECETLMEHEEPGAPVKFETTPEGEGRHPKPALNVVCSEVNATGEVNGVNTEGLVITFSKCASNLGECSSAGAEAGEIVTGGLTATLGIVEKRMNLFKTGISLENESGSFAEFTCGSTSVVVNGSVITEVKANKSVASEVMSFGQKKGVQNITSFFGGPTDVLSASIEGGAPIQSALAMKVEQNNAEANQIKSPA